MPSRERKVLGVDVDGVLADFVTAFALKINVLTGKLVSPIATSWNWYRQDGVTSEEEAHVWDAIIDNPHFWFGLGAYPHTREVIQRLNTLGEHHDIYYITTRPPGAKTVTEDWLCELGAEMPTVLVTNQKGKVASALGVTTFIDDRPENALDVYRHLPCEAHVYLFAQPWNREAQEQWQTGAEGIRVAEGWDEIWRREGLSGKESEISRIAGGHGRHARPEERGLRLGGQPLQ